MHRVEGRTQICLTKFFKETNVYEEVSGSLFSFFHIVCVALSYLLILVLYIVSQPRRSALSSYHCENLKSYQVIHLLKP